MLISAGRPARAPRVLVLLVVGALVVGITSGRAGRAGAEYDPLLAAVASAQAAYATAGASVVDLTRELEALQGEQSLLEDQRRSLDADQQELATHLLTAQREARRYLVGAYVAGGELAATDDRFDPSASTDGVYRTFLVRDHADRSRAAVHDYVETRHRLDDRVAALSEQVDRNAADLAATSTALDEARARWQAAEADLRAADQAVTDRRLLLDGDLGPRGPGVVRSGDDGGPTPDESGNAAGPGWAALRRCESGGNYAAVSASGQYRGAYQFDVTTWRGMGGSGDPAAAPPAEQDYRAQLLYNQRGAQPWPVCGRYLLADPGVGPVNAVPPPVSPAPPTVEVPPLPPTLPVTLPPPPPTIAPTTTTSAPPASVPPTAAPTTAPPPPGP